MYLKAVAVRRHRVDKQNINREGYQVVMLTNELCQTIIFFNDNRDMLKASVCFPCERQKSHFCNPFQRSAITCYIYRALFFFYEKREISCNDRSYPARLLFLKEKTSSMNILFLRYV